MGKMMAQKEKKGSERIIYYQKKLSAGIILLQISIIFSNDIYTSSSLSMVYMFGQTIFFLSLVDFCVVQNVL